MGGWLVNGPLVLPIFVPAEGDLFVFDSVDVAESWLEPVDVRSGSLVSAYDAAGRRLDIRVRGPTRSDRYPVERVVIVCAEESPSGRAELLEILRTYLESVGEEATLLSKASLAELQVHARRHALVPP
jgi:hypothetical protein